MYFGVWICLCVTALCGGKGHSSSQPFPSAMKKPLFIERTQRRLRETVCYDIDGREISQGGHYIPSGNDPCRHCRCSEGQASECFTTKCAVPTCEDFKAVPGKCCAYTCPSDASDKAELAIIVCLSLGLLVLIILLIVIIDRNRKRAKRNRERNRGSNQDNEAAQRPLNNRLGTICEDNEDTHSLPPPYTPSRDRYNVQKIYALSPLSPNEPPPPYDTDNREATQV